MVEKMSHIIIKKNYVCVSAQAQKKNHKDFNISLMPTI